MTEVEDDGLNSCCLVEWSGKILFPTKLLFFGDCRLVKDTIVACGLFLQKFFELLIGIM